MKFLRLAALAATVSAAPLSGSHIAQGTTSSVGQTLPDGLGSKVPPAATLAKSKTLVSRLASGPDGGHCDEQHPPHVMLPNKPYDRRVGDNKHSHLQDGGTLASRIVHKGGDGEHDRPPAMLPHKPYTPRIGARKPQHDGKAGALTSRDDGPPHALLPNEPYDPSTGGDNRHENIEGGRSVTLDSRVAQEGGDGDGLPHAMLPNEPYDPSAGDNNGKQPHGQ
ncbi:hypothetical protein JDV02_005478 [Purpureocillium takamizusanense]|uniref:Uncharacterized protein n=1 Tax=Purpureocillium takamizusanense TaxID=2060973 RepID=A0A9Q8QEF2_9HYPO|nr:uncharacterized protein JDV02_005478 [Purpureocillium takamizusanense]UNI19284.1 hypothetical protein JDV02_005478 [Purpureocillium takamizusanense]